MGLRKMCADRIDHCGLLANEQMARAVEHQAALPLERLGRHEPHVCSGDRFANGLSVCSIILRRLYKFSGAVRLVRSQGC